MRLRNLEMSRRYSTQIFNDFQKKPFLAFNWVCNMKNSLIGRVYFIFPRTKATILSRSHEGKNKNTNYLFKKETSGGRIGDTYNQERLSSVSTRSIATNSS